MASAVDTTYKGLNSSCPRLQGEQVQLTDFYKDELVSAAQDLFCWKSRRFAHDCRGSRQTKLSEGKADVTTVNEVSR
jgi:hypothetical protein